MRDTPLTEAEARQADAALRRLVPRLRRRIPGGPAGATDDDVIQQVLLELTERPELLRTARSIEALLFTMLLARARDTLRRGRRRPWSIAVGDDGTSFETRDADDSDALEPVFRDELLAALAAVRDELPAREGPVLDALRSTQLDHEPVTEIELARRAGLSRGAFPRARDRILAVLRPRLRQGWREWIDTRPTRRGRGGDER